jgi:hypothetical protein
MGNTFGKHTPAEVGKPHSLGSGRIPLNWSMDCNNRTGPGLPREGVDQPSPIEIEYHDRRNRPQLSDRTSF